MQKFDPRTFQIGTDVVTSYELPDKGVVRKITKIDVARTEGVLSTSSGYRVSADGGQPCKSCGATPSKPIKDVCASWFAKVNLKEFLHRGWDLTKFPSYWLITMPADYDFIQIPFGSEQSARDGVDERMDHPDRFDPQTLERQ